MNLPAGFPARSRTAPFYCHRRQDATSHKHVWPSDVRSDQKPQHRHAKSFCREKLHAQARIRAKPLRSCATAKRPLATAPDNPVYSPQRSTSSATVQWLFSTPAAIAGVMRIACGFHEVIIREIQRNRSLKVFKLFAESVRQASQSAAVHPQRVILLFNMRRGNPRHVRHAAHNRLFSFHNFRRAIPNGGWC